MFCKAFKMLFLTGAVLGGTGFLLFGTNLGSYLGTMASSVKESVEGQIPVDFEIKRAEKLIMQIDPQIENCKRDVARAEVELEELHASVQGLEKSTGQEEKRLKTGARLLSGAALGLGMMMLAAQPARADSVCGFSGTSTLPPPARGTDCRARSRRPCPPRCPA